MDNELLKDTVLKLKDRIIKTEAGNIQLSETDTRQGLINPLFRALQWDFGDFESIKSELRVPKFNEPVDYAFYSSKKKTDTPILLLEAKRLGSDLAHKNHVKQLTAYLGATGVQWGVLSDGNRYVLYNSRGGTSFEEQKFLTLEIKTVNTDSGFTLEEFLKHMTTLLSRDCLENEEIQQAYEEHMINSRIRLALDSLLSTPFDTLMAAIRREFKEERVGLPDGIKITDSTPTPSGSHSESFSVRRIRSEATTAWPPLPRYIMRNIKRVMGRREPATDPAPAPGAAARTMGGQSPAPAHRWPQRQKRSSCPGAGRSRASRTSSGAPGRRPPSGRWSLSPPRSATRRRARHTARP